MPHNLQYIWKYLLYDLIPALHLFTLNSSYTYHQWSSGLVGQLLDNELKIIQEALNNFLTLDLG